MTEVPNIDGLLYSWYPGLHYLVDDDGNVVGVFPAIKEVPLSEQKWTEVKNITFWH